MTLTYDIVRYGKLKILGESVTYPSTDNCYRVKVELHGKEFDDLYCPKPVYHIWKTLSEVPDLTWEMMDDLIKHINDYGEWMYNDGVTNESMSNSEDL
jgi:hypothetical protein